MAVTLPYWTFTLLKANFLTFFKTILNIAVIEAPVTVIRMWEIPEKTDALSI